MRVYGNTIEPGGLELDNDSYIAPCKECGKQATYRHWETLDGGCINPHWRWDCNHCGAKDQSMFASDEPDDDANDIRREACLPEELGDEEGFADVNSGKR